MMRMNKENILLNAADVRMNKKSNTENGRTYKTRTSFVCGFCKKKFITINDRWKHYKRKHGKRLDL